jgi:hypothetical protein
MYPKPDRLYSPSHRDEAVEVLQTILTPTLLNHFKALEADKLSGTGADLRALLIDTRARQDCILHFLAYLIPFAGRRGISRNFLRLVENINPDPEKVALDPEPVLHQIP